MTYRSAREALSFLAADNFLEHAGAERIRHLPNVRANLASIIAFSLGDCWFEPARAVDVIRFKERFAKLFARIAEPADNQRYWRAFSMLHQLVGIIGNSRWAPGEESRFLKRCFLSDDDVADVEAGRVSMADLAVRSCYGLCRVSFC
jgi:DNA-binding FadR family transcriptional regulator